MDIKEYNDRNDNKVDIEQMRIMDFITG